MLDDEIIDALDDMSLYLRNNDDDQAIMMSYITIFFQDFNQSQLNELLAGAIERRHFDLPVIRVIIEAGADPRFDNDTCFIKSCVLDRPEITSYLLDLGANINTQDGLALSNACRYNCDNMIKLLLKNDIIVTDSALRVAIQSQSNDVITHVLELNTNPNLILKMTFERIFGLFPYEKIFKLLNQFDPDYHKVIDEL
jgi:hypothetical protein